MDIAKINFAITYLTGVIQDWFEVGYCKIDFCNVHIKLYKISMEVKMTLE